MNKKNIIRLAKKKAQRLAELRRDPRYALVMGRLVQEGLLDSRNIRLNKRKLWIEDLIWVGKEIEPRVLQLLPAIALKRPGILMARDFPRTLRVAMNDIKRGRDGAVYEGVALKKCRDWVPLVGRQGKIPMATRAFRLSSEDQKMLDQLSQILDLSRTDVLRKALHLLFESEMP